MTSEISQADRELLAAETDIALEHDEANAIREGRRDSVYAYAFNAMAYLRSQLEAVTAERDEARSEIARCHARLEIDAVWEYFEDTNESFRVEIPMEDRDKQIDGIECRNDTIKLQDEQIKKLRAKRDRLTDLLTRAGEFTGQFVDRAIQRPDRDGERMGYKYSLACHPFANCMIDDVKALHSEIITALEVK